MLAGLPKAPSSFNPVVNPKRAKQRQLYVLRRMHELGYLNDDAVRRRRRREPLMVRRDIDDFAVHAEYVAEMVRQILYERYPDDVYTPRLPRLHHAARSATRRPRTSRCAAASWTTTAATATAARRATSSCPRARAEEGLEDVLQEFPDSDDLLAAVVLEAEPEAGARPTGAAARPSRSPKAGLKFVASALAEKTPPNRRIRRGAVIRDPEGREGRLADPAAARRRGGVRRARPADGAMRALVGGFDFQRNKYNHVTQAWRQPGSSFKPFIYSAALEKGFTPGDDHQRRAGRRRRRADRRPGLGAEELRRQVRRADAPAHRAREVEEHGVDPRSCSRSARSTRRTTSRASASMPTSTRPTSPWRSAPARSRRGRWRAPTRCSRTAATGSTPT